MRKQRLPQEFWTGISLFDRNTYCFWYANGEMKKCRVLTQKEARDFIKRAEDRNTAAFASTFIDQDGEHQIFACSFKDNLKKYESKDWIRLEIAGANYKLIHYPEKKAKSSASIRSVEQWNSKEYDLLYNKAEYHVSWYNTTKHCFEEAKFTKIEDAETEFNSKKVNDIPVRLTECMLGSHRIHEVKAACQHWHIGMGNYLEQMAKGTLPVGEIPYAFSNSYLTSELEVNDDNGYLYFRDGFNEYSIQISRGCNGISILTGPAFEMKIISHVVVERNPILDPWIARIERQW